jgi:protein TonB
MKRKTNRCSGFDEIIFENRNREYGAYDLRKRYKSVTSFSVLIGVFIGISLVLSLSFTVKEPESHTPTIVGQIDLNNYVPMDIPLPEPAKMPKGLEDVMRNLKPVVTDDTIDDSGPMLIMDDLVAKVTNGDVNDTVLRIIPVDDPVVPSDPEPMIIVQEMPEFPGGMEVLLATIAQNLHYPEEAIEANIQGKVILKFVIEPDGSVGRIEILRGVDSQLDKEATRVIGTLPKFKPGRQNGVAVPVWFTIPVTFQLKMN